MSQEEDQEADLDLTPRASMNCLELSALLNMDRSPRTTEQGEDPDLGPTKQGKDPELGPQAQLPTQGSIHCLHTSELLKVAVHGMGNLINSRLPKPAMDLCIELLEAGVNPKALAGVVLFTLAVKNKTEDD